MTNLEKLFIFFEAENQRDWDIYQTFLEAYDLNKLLSAYFYIYLAHLHSSDGMMCNCKHYAMLLL